MRRLLPIAFALFFLSGWSALVYEVSWLRLLARVFGGTSLALTTVLAAFMAGLALGSAFWGSRIDRRWNPLAVFGWLELGVGASALLLPPALSALTSLLPALHRAGMTAPGALAAARGLTAFAILLPPTFLMGGSLPVLARAVTREGTALGARLGALYAVNTLGAVTGTLAAGFLLLPSLGLAHTMYAAAAVNALVGCAALLSARAVSDAAPSRVPVARDDDGSAAPRKDRRETLVATAAFGVSGACALALEVLWTRQLAMVLGTTVYAFSVLLAVFLFGLAAGSMLAARFVDRARRPLDLLGAVLLSAALTATGTLALFGRFPELFLALSERWGSGWNAVVAIQAGLSATALLLPTLSFGAVFPVVARLVGAERERLGGRIGTAYAVNTVGAIVGTVAGGLLLLPHAGVRSSSFGVVIVLALAGAAVVFAGKTRARRRLAAAGAAALVLLLAALVPAWDPALMTRGVYLSPESFGDVSHLRRSARETHLLYYGEGSEATVSVEEVLGQLTLRIDGKADASTGEDMVTQALLAHLPLALHPQPRDVLVIGLGSGVTLGAAATHPLRSVTCVEISPEVVEAAAFFREASGDALADPRVTLLREDARHVLLREERRYDCIISEPSNPWISGMGDLFTEEFFTLMRDRLAPGGLVCQWLHTYRLSGEDVRALLRTFQRVFPHVTLWTGSASDLVAIGSVDPVPFSVETFLDHLRAPAARANLAAAGFPDAVSVLGSYVAGEADLARALAAGNALVTDDNLRLEFAGPHSIRRDTRAENLPFLAEIEGCPLEEAADEAALDDTLTARLERGCEARHLMLESLRAESEGRLADAFNRAAEAYDLAPGDPLVRWRHAAACADAGRRELEAKGPSDRAMTLLERAADLSVAARHVEVQKDLGLAWFQRGDAARAAACWRDALAGDPLDTSVRVGLGLALAQAGRLPEAAANYERVLAIEPGHTEAMLYLGETYAALGRVKEARSLLERVASSGQEGLTERAKGTLSRLGRAP